MKFTLFAAIFASIMAFGTLAHAQSEQDEASYSQQYDSGYNTQMDQTNMGYIQALGHHHGGDGHHGGGGGWYPPPPAYEWVYSYTDNHGGCNSCQYSCNSVSCNEYTLGARMACHVPGTHDNSYVYVCQRVR